MALNPQTIKVKSTLIEKSKKVCLIGKSCGFKEYETNQMKDDKTSTTSSCSIPISAQKLRANSVQRVLFANLMLQMAFYNFHRFHLGKSLLK